MTNNGKFTNYIHKEGYVFIAIFTAITLVFFTFSNFLGLICLIATLWCAYFFRNPERYTVVNDDLVISPADGIIQSIKFSPPPPELEMGEHEMLRISIFLNVFNVHVNRVPVSGKVLKLHYHPGKFINASLDKASIHNERQSVLVETNNQTKVAFVQIAGLIARRIVCDLEEGDDVKSGERFGIIRFGSRMDVYLPKHMVALVAEGQTSIAGETVLADMSSTKIQPPKFEVR